MARSLGLKASPWLVGLTGLSLVLGACSRRSGSAGSDTAAISNRPQSYAQFIAVVKLQSPALLSSARRLNGRIVIDEALKQQILAEQATAVSDLQALSPDLRVLFRYRLVLNGLAVLAPRSLEDSFRQMANVSSVEGDGAFAAPTPTSIDDASALPDEDINRLNSVSFIGAQRVHDELGITGKGVRVGVIDTGVDYTHAMFGGVASEQAYQQIDPTKPAPGAFPNAKVIGGSDLVGSEFDAASANFAQHIPHPDANPIDEQGHGTHVSGTIAGLGDGKETYSGVAPDAKIFAIKVFGKKGSTSDSVIIASLELAANPSGDLDPSDHLDVVNLSLGGGFGTPHNLYNEAVKNLVKGDTVMVAAAGNSGDNPYIVSSPSTAAEALSVAATVDGMLHNWQFNAALFSSAAHPSLISEEIEASFAKPIAKAGDVTGPLVALGTAATELSDAQKAAVKGKIALVDRGQVSFFEKAKRAADAGAIGVVVANNVDGEVLAMGGEGHLEVPAFMINKALAETLKADLRSGEVVVHFKSSLKVEKPALIDSIASFSSRGPRSIDGLMKPEISAPGANVISAKMGGGSKGVQLSGTSMATPHMAGVMALLKQAHPDWPVEAMKSLVMNTSLVINDPKTLQAYPLATMGAGRVQVYDAATSRLTMSPPSLSFGEVQVDQDKDLDGSVVLTNWSDEPVSIQFTATGLSAGLSVKTPASVTIAAHAAENVPIHLHLAPAASNDAAQEYSGFVLATSSQGKLRLPLFMVIDRTTHLRAAGLTVKAPAAAGAAGAPAQVTLSEQSALPLPRPGKVLPFNLLGVNSPNLSNVLNPFHGGVCDLQSAGWRLLTKTVDGSDKTLVQIGVKLFHPLTTWQLCDISVQIDGSGDGQVAQELLGTVLQSLNNNDRDLGTFVSALTDAGNMRRLRRDYEVASADPAKAATPPDYSTAIIDRQEFQTFGHSTLAVITADLSKLARLPNGDLKFKIATLADTLLPQSDDYLGRVNDWLTIKPEAAGEAFVNLPEEVTLAAGDSRAVALTKGSAAGDLVLYFPYNTSTLEAAGRDEQQVILTPAYQP